jgi:hypothetical protein
MLPLYFNFLRKNLFKWEFLGTRKEKISPGVADLVNPQRGLIQITNWIMSSFLLHLILQLHILHIFTTCMVMCDTNTADLKRIRVKHLNCLKYSIFLKIYRHLLDLPIPYSFYYFSLWVHIKRDITYSFFKTA